jgi:hypothetical protein
VRNEAARTIAIDRIALSLDGVDGGDARLIASQLGAAIEARLASREGVEDEPADNTPLVTALRGQALVDAVAARLVATLLAQEEVSWP